MKIRHFFYFLLCMGTLAPARGAALTSGADFLLMTTGARPDGMGQAFSAVADDINTLSFNPAGLGNIRLPEIGYGHVSFFSDINYDFVGAAIPVGGMGVLGLGYLGMGTAPFNSTDPSSGIPAVSVQNTALIGAWGKSFYNLHLGAAVKYISETVAGTQGTGFAFDLGARYRILPQLTLAGSVLNIGPGIQFTSLESLPMVVNGGLAWTLHEDPVHSITLAMDGSYEIPTATQRYGLGAEYWYKKMFALRAGYTANSQVEGFSAGAGIQFSAFELDYAFEPYNNLGSVHRVSGLVRWDGPWVSGGEPNPPQFVTVKQTYEALEIRWDKARGPVQAYEVLVQPMDGGEAVVSPPVPDTHYEFKKFAPNMIYRVSVRSIGTGGARSFPSTEQLFSTQSQESILKSTYAKGDNNEKQSVSKGLYGKVDSIGLQLSWTPSRESQVIGYNLYRKSPTGQIEKVTQEPKQKTRVWVTSASGFWGWEWTVTAVRKGGQEKTLGSYLWWPSPGEMESFEKTSRRQLKAVSQPNRQAFLVWDGDPDAVGYDILYSLAADGVYEVYRESDKADTNLLLEIPGGHSVYYLMIVSKKSRGELSNPTQTAKVDLYINNP